MTLRPATCSCCCSRSCSRSCSCMERTSVYFTLVVQQIYQQIYHVRYCVHCARRPPLASRCWWWCGEMVQLGYKGNKLIPFISQCLLLACANIELSPVSDTSCMLNYLIYLINRQYLCGKCPKPVTIQYFRPVYTDGPTHRRRTIGAYSLLVIKRFMLCGCDFVSMMSS